MSVNDIFSLIYTNQITRYSLYTGGTFAVLYTILFIIRYILMFYIIMMMKKIAKKFIKFEKKQKKYNPVKIHEDEKYRDQKNEIFKQQASEIQASQEEGKEIEGGDTIEVQIEKVGANIFEERDVFSQGTPRLEANIMEEIIVGIMPLGKFAKGLLGKREREILQSMMRDMNTNEQTKWRDYISARKAQQQHQNRNF